MEAGASLERLAASGVGHGDHHAVAGVVDRHDRHHNRPGDNDHDDPPDHDHAGGAPGGDDRSEWRAGGRVSKAWPNKEDSTWWLSNGPGMLQQWADWWERSKADGWTVWTTPTGVPAIELPVMAVIGSVPLRGYIDAILVDPDGDLCLMDWKTSAMNAVSTPPPRAIST